MAITTPQQLAESLTEILGETIPEIICSKLTEKEFKLVYVRSRYTPVDLNLVRNILINAKSRLRKPGRPETRAYLQMKRSQEKAKPLINEFYQSVNYQEVERRGAERQNDYSLSK